jgi:translation initiation factor 2 beta subunit (eIF-2beta)/eIF-5
MKNIHILPTEKPSRLYLHSENELQLRTNIIRTSEDYLGSNQHIYITSDEEIKYDDYYLGEDNNIYCLVTTVNYNGKKIILTTDQDLIKDGVQAIDYEFLEWFVKNPSCEKVEVAENTLKVDLLEYKTNYKIILYE